MYPCFRRESNEPTDVRLIAFCTLPGYLTTVGICEEPLYRCWLQNLPASSTGLVRVGQAPGAAVFGCEDPYRGRKGTLKTAIIGLIFAGVFIASLPLCHHHKWG